MQNSSPNPANGSQGIHNLGTLLKRLEAATSRLEDIALAQQSAGTVAAQLGSVQPAIAIPGGGAASTPSPPPAPPAAIPPAPDSQAVGAFRQLIDGPLKAYVDASQELGDLVAKQATLVQSLFNAQLEFLRAASSCKKISTSDPSYMPLLKPTQEALMAVVEVKEKNRGSKQINHLSEVSEGIPALGWVTVEKTPGPFVNEMKDAAQFYANRVVKEFKESDPKQIAWARGFVALLDELRKYVLAHHTTGLMWNPKGQDVSSYLSSGSSSSSSIPSPPTAPAAPGPPGPPPPPSAPGAVSAPTAPKSKAAAGDMSAVFGDLNKGGDVTKGLRKVDKSEMTHKNPSLRSSSVVAATDSASPSAPSIPKKPTALAKKPAKKELDGTKWTVENFENDREIVIDNTEISHTINVFSCKNSVIQIKGKVNAVTLVGCTKTSILLDSTVSSLSLTNCPSFAVQILGVVPIIMVDSTDGGQIYLSKASAGVELITSKTSGLNVSVPKAGGEEGDYDERPVPEQMKTTIASDGRLKTEIVEHAG